MKRLNDIEALKIAVEMEKRGVELYKRAGRIAKNDETRKMIAELEAQEEQHAQRFKELQDKALLNSEDAEFYSDEASSFLNALAAEIVFPGGLMKLAYENGLEDPAVVLQQAIEAEKNSILLYTGVVESSKSPEMKYWLEKIIEEERGHLIGLISQVLRLGQSK